MRRVYEKKELVSELEKIVKCWRTSGIPSEEQREFPRDLSVLSDSLCCFEFSKVVIIVFKSSSRNKAVEPLDWTLIA